MQKRRIRTAALFLALLMLFAPVNAGLLSQASSEPELNTKVTFAESYAVGTRISIPNAEFADASGSYATTAKVISPDGNEHIGNSFTIQNKGTHTVVYSAVVGNEEVKKEFTFSAYYPLFSVEKKSSGTPYYGASSMYGGISGRDGVVVSLSSGDTFHWGEIIDLKGKTSLDSLIKLYVTPQTLGKADTSKICVILTDIYNPDNYVTVTFKKVIAVMVGAQWAEVNSFVTAGSSKQLQTGMRQDNVKGTFEYEGQMYYLEAGTKMGTQVSALSLPGTPKYVQDNDASVSAELFLANPQLMTVSFDYENAKVFAGRIDADANNSDPNKTDIKLIADLDAEQCFDTLWGGFTTGEVYLSIKGQEYLSSSLNFVVTEVNGESVSDKVSNGNTVTDNVPPALTVSAPSPIPNALVGVPYTLFPASAADIYDGEIKPTVTVKQGTTVVEVKNGKFIPTKEGNYTVTYRATDYAGNATRDTANRYTVTAVTGNPLSATLGSYETTGYLTGLPVTVADFTTADARGTVDAFITAKCKDRVYDVKDGAFIPLDVGEYTVEYIVTDYIGKTNLSYTVTVGENPDAVIIGTPALPLYYMSGMIYSAPKLDAYTWKNGIPQKTACDVYYGSDGVTYRKAGDLFTPTSSDTVYLKFSINTEGKTAESVFTVPAVDVGYNQNKLAMENYFHFTQGTPTVSADGKSILYTLNGDSAFTYVNLLQTEVFSFKFLPKGLQTAEITLTDGSGTSLTVTYTYGLDGKMTVTLSAPKGTKQIKVEYDITADNETPQILSYTNASQSLNITEKRSVSLSDIFEGFSGNVWMQVKLLGMASDSSIRIYSLNEQTFSNLNIDRIDPTIITDIETGERALGDIAHIGVANISDVLDCYVVSYMYVLAPDGNYATALDGTVLDYRSDYTRAYDIKLDTFGKYVIFYYAKDSAGNDTSYTVQITVVDAEPPQIQTTEKDRYVRVGDIIIPAEYTVSDNMSAPENIHTYTYITAPDGSVLTNGEAKATLRGVYTIHYYAFDEAQNCNILTFRVTAY